MRLQWTPGLSVLNTGFMFIIPGVVSSAITAGTETKRMNRTAITRNGLTSDRCVFIVLSNDINAPVRIGGNDMIITQVMPGCSRPDQWVDPGMIRSAGSWKMIRQNFPTGTVFEG